jgi:hypothetical protein
MQPSDERADTAELAFVASLLASDGSYAEDTSQWLCDSAAARSTAPPVS